MAIKSNTMKEGWLVNCFIYTRKSSEDRRQVLSLADQENACREVALLKGLRVLKVFSESKSARRPHQRPDFQEMVNGIEQGLTDTIICWKADRLARNAKEGGQLIDLVDYSKLKIVTPAYDYTRENSTFLFIEFGMATKFSKDLSDNIKRGLKTKLKMGHYPGHAPLGYLNNKLKEKGLKDISPDPEKFNLCRQWWELMLTGQFTIEESLKAISKMGLRANSGREICKASAYDFFKNIFYTGLFDYHGERFQGVHKPMITMTEYKRVQDIITGRSHRNRHKNNFFFMRILKCGECGSPITAEEHVKKNGKSYVYARCTKKRGQCRQPYLNAKELEIQVIGFVNSLEVSPRLVEWVRGVLKRRNEAEFGFEKKLKARKTKRLLAIMEEKKRLWDMKFDGLLDEKDYQAEKGRLLIEEKQLKEGLGDSLDSWTKVAEETLAFASNVSKIYEEGDSEVKRMVLQILGSNLILKDKNLQIQAKNAFIAFKEAEKSLCKVSDSFELQKSAVFGDNLIFKNPKSTRELTDNFYSNLFDYITPELRFQLFALKNKMGIESFTSSYLTRSIDLWYR